MRNRKRKRRKPREENVVKVKFPAFAWEAWNLGFLNQDAETALAKKLGGRWCLYYSEATLVTQQMYDAEDHLFTTEKIAPMIRMILATGLHENAPTESPANIAVEDFSLMLKRAWMSKWQSFLNSVRNQVCRHYSFQDVMELQANHFFQMMKRDVLEFVNEMKKHPCPCCPTLSFMIIDTAEFTNRGVDLLSHLYSTGESNCAKPNS